jgi:hypothetical protein
MDSHAALNIHHIACRSVAYPVWKQRVLNGHIIQCSYCSRSIRDLVYRLLGVLVIARFVTVFIVVRDVVSD